MRESRSSFDDVRPARVGSGIYRSRAEARWAIVFDRCNIEYFYEPQFFTTPAGGYLPDFFLGSLGFWWEVKGQHPTDTEIRKMQAVVKQTGNLGVVTHGGPPSMSNVPYAISLISPQSDAPITTTWSRLVCHYPKSEVGALDSALAWASRRAFPRLTPIHDALQVLPVSGCWGSNSHDS